MSNSFSTSNHQPRFTGDFSELEIVDTTADVVVQTFDLSQSTKIKVESGNFVISQESCSNCHSQAFDSTDNDEVTFTGNRMAGVTIIRIEGTLRTYNEYTFQLDCCPVYLHYQNGKLNAQAATDGSGSGFDPACVKFRTYQTQTA